MEGTYIAVFDIGTTAIKGVLIDQDAKIFGEMSVDVETIYRDSGEVEQIPNDWWEGVCFIAKYWWRTLEIHPGRIHSITFSGQMEDVIPVTYCTRKQPNAILYSDHRAEGEAERINRKMPRISSITGNIITATTPLAKILWVEANHQAIDSNIHAFLFSSKDYIIYKLTEALVTDPVTGTTTGLMNLNTKTWDDRIINCMELDMKKLPALLYPHEAAGKVTKEASKETGFMEGTPVLCGCGDGGATTMGAGAIREGDSYIYLGTTGWVAFPSIFPKQEGTQIFTLAHMPRDLYISIAPLLNVGNVYQWAIDSFIDCHTENKYEEFERLVKRTEAGAGGVLCLPYLQGERGHIQDHEARGAFRGIHAETKKEHFLRAVIEGVCFSIRQALEILISQKNNGSLSLIGGGTKSRVWCQCLADILGRTIKVTVNSEYLPAMGAAASAFIYLGWVKTYEQFADQYLKGIENTKEYHPTKEHVHIYEKLYHRFNRLYPSLRNIYLD